MPGNINTKELDNKFLPLKYKKSKRKKPELTYTTTAELPDIDAELIKAITADTEIVTIDAEVKAILDAEPGDDEKKEEKIEKKEDKSEE